MAKQIKNNKGFLVIKMSYQEYAVITDTFARCDLCGDETTDGYYIPMIKQWYCQECYELWNRTAVHYKVDEDVERRRFNIMKQKIDLLGSWEE